MPLSHWHDSARLFLRQFGGRSRGQIASHRSQRSLRCERLEPRQMLSADVGAASTVGSFGSLDATSPVAVISTLNEDSLAARDQALTIVAVQLRVGERELTITSLDEIVTLDVGDKLQVVGIDYRVRTGEIISGKIAFEGYLNKLAGKDFKTDYSDGRFGAHEQSGQLPEGIASHQGLSDGWKLEAGDESVSLVMVRYHESGATVADRVKIRTQVGTPDFAFEGIEINRSKEVFSGKKVKIKGSWANHGGGEYFSHAEVNIYHASDPTEILWVGTLSGVAGSGEDVSGHFQQKHDARYTKEWVPNDAGTYLLKFYADPEDHWHESNNDNNVFTMRIEVFDQGKPARNSTGALRQHGGLVDPDESNLPADVVSPIRPIEVSSELGSESPDTRSVAERKAVSVAEGTDQLLILSGEHAVEPSSQQEFATQPITAERVRAVDAALSNLDESLSATLAVTLSSRSS